MKDFEIAMRDFNAVNLMCIGFDDYEEFINSKIKENKEYAEAEDTYLKYLDEIKEKEGFKYMDEMDDAVTVMEYTARNVAFNEGFKMGIRFIQDFISKGGV